MSNPEEGTIPEGGVATAAPTDDDHPATPPTSEEDSEPVAAEAAADEPTSTDEDTTPEPTPEVTVSDSNPVIAHLSTLGVEGDVAQKIVDDYGVAAVEDLAVLTETDFTAAGVKLVQARKLVAAVVPTVTTTGDVPVTNSFDMLPEIPDEGSWLEELKTGGILKVQQSTVIAAIRAALADRVGFYDIPKRLVQLMEQHADEISEPVDPIFYKLRKQLTRRNYGDLFEAIGGLDGTFVTDARKKELLSRIDRLLWPAIADFNSQLSGWQEAWTQGTMSPLAFGQLIMGARQGGVMPAAASIAPPDTGVLHDAAEGVIEAMNTIFSGTGAQIAAALAYEARQIRDSFADSRLPSLTGSSNREQMLKKLGISVTSADPRMERNLNRFVLGIMQAKNQPSGEPELRYFNDLFVCGSQIPWNSLERGSGSLVDEGVTGIGGSRRAGRVETPYSSRG